MSYEILYHNSKLDKIMTREQFDLIIEAILAGKYSWACVLILRFGGQNPVDYIPYRTFNRLMKENRQGCQPSKHRSRGEDEVKFIEKNNNSKIANIAARKENSSQRNQESMSYPTRQYAGNI